MRKSRDAESNSAVEQAASPKGPPTAALIPEQSGDITSGKETSQIRRRCCRKEEKAAQKERVCKIRRRSCTTKPTPHVGEDGVIYLLATIALIVKRLEVLDS